jgi:putative ABC transport system substrate-binding protein
VDAHAAETWGDVRRRELILGAGAAILGTIARAQVPRRYRLGIFGWAGMWEGKLEGIIDELGRLGYARGVRLEVHERFPQAKKDLDELPRQLVAIPVDVILTEGSDLTRRLQQTTKVIPIVTTVGDAVAFGFARTLQKPGGNITGLSQNRAGHTRKLFELLRLLRPGITEMASLDGEPWKDLADAASEAGLRLRSVNVRELGGLEKTFEQLKVWHIDTAFSRSAFPPERAAIAVRYRIAIIANGVGSAEAGALVGSEHDGSGDYVRVASIIDKIFKGQKPADIPFEEASRFITAVNAKTAAALGMRLTPEVRLRVDRVFE